MFHIKTNVNVMKNLRTIKVAGLFLSIGFACLLSSCDKNDSEVSKPQSIEEVSISDGVTLKEGRLAFENGDAFKEQCRLVKEIHSLL
jgi:hypothetical protein